jgi:hypothetical protein
MALVAVGLILVALIQVLCLFALVDQYKSLLQIRDALRLVDTPQELPLIGVDGILPSSIGLPAVVDAEPFAVVLLLSTKCTTCKAVARGMNGQVPARSWAVIEGRSDDECREFQREVGLAGQEVLIDVGGQIADRLRTRTFPSAVVFSNGAARSVRTVPSYRQFRQMLDRREESYSEAV